MDPFTSSCCGMIECIFRVSDFENIFLMLGISLSFNLIEHLAVDALRCR